jgi:hypothetical protein
VHCYNQTGLIDTEISTILDLALSPGLSQDKPLFMLTWGGDFSLWRSPDNGAEWQRVLSSASAEIDSLDLVQLPPGYGENSQTVFLSGSGGGGPAIWKSGDNGQSFTRQSAPLAIDHWAIADDSALFLASFNGTGGLLYKTTDGGISYSVAVVGSQSLSSIALSPDYARDGTILIGNTNGGVYLSSDNGNQFRPIPLTTTPPLTGNVSVAFDPLFSTNQTVYASSDNPDGGIYRFVISTSSQWERIDDSLPAGAMIGKLVVSANGALYAGNFQQADIINKRGGVERCLEPAPGATFETVTEGLSDGATLFGLWLSGNQLWSIDTTNNRLMTYTDTLAQPISLTSPPDRATGVGTVTGGAISNVNLDWEPPPGATSYQWQLDNDNDFSRVPAGFEGNTERSSVILPPLKTGTTYYWRVRANGPVLSLWSETRSFTTSSANTVSPGAESSQPTPTGTPTAEPEPEEASQLAAQKTVTVFVTQPAPKTEITIVLETTPTPTSQKAETNSSPAQPSPPQSPPIQLSPATPEWVFYLMSFMGAIIILLLVSVLLLVARRR